VVEKLIKCSKNEIKDRAVIANSSVATINIKIYS
jgi:hypothetical protein